MNYPENDYRNYLIHYGVDHLHSKSGRGSGRYPYGSGKKNQDRDDISNADLKYLVNKVGDLAEIRHTPKSEIDKAKEDAKNAIRIKTQRLMIDKKISRKEALKGLEQSLTEYSNKQFGYSGRKQIEKIIDDLKNEKPRVLDRNNKKKLMLGALVGQSVLQQQMHMATRQSINSGLMAMSLSASMGMNPYMFGMV